MTTTRKLLDIGGHTKATIAIPAWAQEMIDHPEGVGNTTQAYGRVPQMYRAVMLRANALACVPFIVHKGEKLVSWPFPQALNKLLGEMEASLMVAGGAYALKLQPASGGKRTVGLQFLTPSSMTVKYDARARTTEYRQRIGNMEYGPWDSERMLFMREFSFVTEVGNGLAPAQVALPAANLRIAMQDFASGFFSSGAQPMTLLTIAGNPAPTEIDRTERFFKRSMQGVRNAWRVLAMRSEVTVQPITPAINTMAMPEMHETTTREIAAAFGIPLSLLTSDSANYATAQSDMRLFYENTIKARLMMYEAALNEQVLGAMGLHIKFTPEALSIYQEDEAERSGALLNLVNAGIPLSNAMLILGYEVEDVTGMTTAQETVTTSGAEIPVETQTETSAKASQQPRVPAGSSGGGQFGAGGSGGTSDDGDQLTGDHTYESGEDVVGVKLPAAEKAAVRAAFPGRDSHSFKTDGTLEVYGNVKTNAGTSPQQWGEQKRGYAQTAVQPTHTAHLVSVDEAYRPRGAGVQRTAVIKFTTNTTPKALKAEPDEDEWLEAWYDGWGGDEYAAKAHRDSMGLELKVWAKVAGKDLARALEFGCDHIAPEWETWIKAQLAAPNANVPQLFEHVEFKDMRLVNRDQRKVAAVVTRLFGKYAPTIKAAAGLGVVDVDTTNELFAAIGDKLAPILEKIYTANIKQLITDNDTPIDREVYTTYAQDWANKYTFDQLTGELTDSTIKNLQRVVAKLVQDPTLTAAQISAGLFPTFSPYRVAMIATTEVTRAEAATANGYYDILTGYGDTVVKRWSTKIDERVCPFCGPLDMKKDKVYAKQFPAGPPAHPNCRCNITVEVDADTEDVGAFD